MEPALQSNTFLAEVMEATPDGEKLLTCLQCGTCSGSCPSGPDMDYSPRKVFALIRAGEREKVMKSNTPWYCVSCYSCMVRCPKEIPITDIMYTLKNKAIAEKSYEDRDAPDWSRTFMGYVENNGRSFELGLATRYHLTHNPLSKTNLASFGLGMLTKDRLSLFPEKIKGIKQLRAILNEAKNMENE